MMSITLRRLKSADAPPALPSFIGYTEGNILLQPVCAYFPGKRFGSRW